MILESLTALHCHIVVLQCEVREQWVSGFVTHLEFPKNCGEEVMEGKDHIADILII